MHRARPPGRGTPVMRIGRWRTFLDEFVPSSAFRDDAWALRACSLAVAAAESDCHGVGAALYDGDGRVLVEGRNEVHAGPFRSDLHAEMVVMNRYEAMGFHRSEARHCTLVTSLEPCPMCMCRLIVAGVGTVLYVAADAVGGMVQRRRGLPPTFRALIHSEGQAWRSADCSEDLRTAAFEIWSASRERLNMSAPTGEGRARASGTR